MTVVAATRSHADELLAALGATRQQVAANLQAAGITGQPLMCMACPVAVYLLKHLDGASEVLVSDVEISIYYGTDPEPEVIKTPAAVAGFVYAFDGGHHPTLIAGGEQ